MRLGLNACQPSEMDDVIRGDGVRVRKKSRPGRRKRPVQVLCLVCSLPTISAREILNSTIEWRITKNGFSNCCNVFQKDIYKKYNIVRSRFLTPVPFLLNGNFKIFF